MRPDQILARRQFLALSAAAAGASALGLAPFGRLLAHAGLPAGRIAGFGSFSPDGRWLFVNVYTPGFSVAITGPWKEGLL